LNSRSSAQLAAVIITKNQGTCQTYVNDFLAVTQRQSATPEDKVRGVLCVGEIGTLIDLSVVPNIMEILSSLF